MDIHLETHDEFKKLSLENISNWGDGEFACDAVVKSGWITCKQRFYFDRYHAEAFLQALVRMYTSFEGETTLQQEHEMQFITFLCNKLGQITVSGELFEDAIVYQSVKFMFETDQTVLPGFIEQFELLLGKDGKRPLPDR